MRRRAAWWGPAPPIAHARDVDDGLTLGDAPPQHAAQGLVVRLEVCLLDGVAAVGEQRLFDDLADAAEVGTGGGDEDFRNGSHLMVTV